MKELRLFFCMCAVAFSAPAIAQLPDIGTADAPKWYYIQVVGDESRADRVFTLSENSKVDGLPLSLSTDISEISRQLWRFEKNAAGRYAIINMQNGQQLDVAYDDEEETGRAVVRETSGVGFTLKPFDGYYQIISSSAAEGTPSGEIYLHQGNSGYNYAVITVSTTYSEESSSKFHFVPFDDFRIAYSDDETVTWYNIFNGNPSYASSIIAENTATDVPFSLVLENSVENEKRAQWKAVAAGDGVIWTNRATGHVLQPVSKIYGAYNLLQAVPVIAPTNAWTPVYLGNKQYAFSAKEDDGITRYMGTVVDGDVPTAVPAVEKLGASSYSWELRVAEVLPTGIEEHPAEQMNKIKVNVVNRQIVVEGAESWKIHTPAGLLVSVGKRLDPGIYIVSSKEESVKVVVK